MPENKLTQRTDPISTLSTPSDNGTHNGWLRRIQVIVYDFLIGATLSWVLVPYQIRKRREMEQLISLIFSSQIMGMPLLPPRERLALLPYMMPSLMHWRRMSIFDRAMEGADLRHLGH